MKKLLFIFVVLHLTSYNPALAAEAIGKPVAVNGGWMFKYRLKIDVHSPKMPTQEISFIVLKEYTGADGKMLTRSLSDARKVADHLAYLTEHPAPIDKKAEHELAGKLAVKAREENKKEADDAKFLNADKPNTLAK